MAAPSITAFPEKIINTFLSKWNASSLPIQYTINNDKFPVGEAVTNYFTQVLIFINGSLVATIKQIPDSNNNTKVDVRKYAQTALKLVQSSGVRDTNASCNIYITGSEEYIDAAGAAQSNAITGGGPSVLHFATLSALPFGGTRGGNMYDYIIDRNKADLGKFMTFFIRGQLVDTTDFLLSFILQEPGYDIEVKQFDINAVLLVTDLISIADDGIGVYRITLGGTSFDIDNVNYLTVQILTDTYGTAVSEVFNIDVDFDCNEFVTLAAPSGLAAVAGGVRASEIDLSWTSNSDGEESGFGVERGTDGIVFVQIATTATGVVTFDDTGLDAGTEYFYRVRALGAIPSAYSNTASLFTFDADAEAWLALMTAPTAPQQTAINIFVIGAKIDGNWQLLDYIIVPKLGSTNGVIDAFGKVATINGGTVFDSNGAVFDGIDSYLDTLYNISDDGNNASQDDASAGVYSAVAAAFTSQMFPFAGRNGSGNGVTIIQNVANMQYQCNNGISNNSGGDDVFLSDQFVEVTRVDSANQIMYIDGDLDQSTAAASNAPSAVDIYVGGLHQGVGMSNFCDFTAGFFYIAGGIGFDHSGMNTRMRTLIAAI